MNDRTDEVSPSSADATDELSPEELGQILDDQRRRSERGQSFKVETYLEQTPALKSNAEALLDLIYNEMMLREAQGDKPALEEYVRRFPHLARQLSDQFEIENVLQDDTLVEPAQKPPKLELAPPPTRDFLDYEVMEMLGRGGKGVVYKAKQKSLNRIVALKMIRSGDAATLDDRARFRLEAEAVARLHHPNLVQIYEVGERHNEPYLTLEFVDGGSLAQRLDGKPIAADAAAGMIETLAQAIHHAHLKGIVHRDLKPANVLLQQSAASSQQSVEANAKSLTADCWLLTAVPKITDFGLAKFVIEETQGLTETGMFLGTPAYTAPEQALGHNREVGPAADIYALGAILYELLTGKPPFQGPSAFYVLEQVRTSEPVALTRHTPSLPRDLETICLKCLEKDPNRRYASALLLAEDLQRFRTGQPIMARPVGRVERVRKWVRRRPAVAGLIAVLVVSSFATLVGGWWAAYTQAKLRYEADENLKHAEANFDHAIDAVGYFLDDVGGIELTDVPQLEPVRKKVLLHAKDFYDAFLLKRGEDPRFRLQAGRGFSRLGTIHELLDEHAAAEKAYRRAIELLEVPDDASRHELGRTLNHFAGLLKKLGRTTEAEEIAQRGLTIRKELAERFPQDASYQQELASSHHDLATIRARLPKKRAAAQDSYGDALRLQEALLVKAPSPQHQRDVARTLNNLGLALQQTKPAIAVTHLRRAITTNQELVAKYPDTPAYRRELARTCNNIAGVLSAAKRGEAEQNYNEALTHLKQLSRDYPKVPAYRQDLAGVHANLGLFHENVGLLHEESRQWREANEQYDRAAKSYEESALVRRQLAAESSEVPEYQQKLASTLMMLGNLHERRDQIVTADKHFREAIALYEKIAIPGCRPVYLSELGQALNQRGTLYARRSKVMEGVTRFGAVPITGAPWPMLAVPLDVGGDMKQSLDLIQRAVALQRSAFDADPANLSFRGKLYDTYRNLVVPALACADHATAAEAAAEALRYSPKAKGDYVLAAEQMASCVALVDADRRVPLERRIQLAEAYAEKTMTFLRLAVSLGFGDRQEEVIFLERCREFDPLRERPAFRELLKRRLNNPAVAT